MGDLGGGYSNAWGINNNGQVVGKSFDGSNWYPYLYSNGTMSNLGLFPGGDPLHQNNSTAAAVNNNGQVAGWAADGALAHGFLYSSGTMTSVGTLGGPQSLSNARGINDSGQVVGQDHGNGGTTAYIYSNGVMTYLNSLLPSGARWYLTDAIGINSAGQIAGTGYAPNGVRAYLYNGGNITNLGTLGGTGSSASGINNKGQVVGYAETDTTGISHAFVYSNGVMTDLGTLGRQHSSAAAINNSGQVVGEVSGMNALPPYLGPAAFLYSNGVTTDLNSLLSLGSGWQLNEATGINDKGQIVGNGAINGQGGHAFLLTPTGIGVASNAPIMPISSSGGTFQFSFSVGTTPLFIDPLTAIGYDYLINSGPLFQSVMLPNIGDGLFELWLWDGTDWVFNKQLTHEMWYDFALGGIDRFRIVGIEASAGLDPNDPGAFVTGLTFAGQGPVDMTMQALTDGVNAAPVPEPSTWLLMGSGLVGFVVFRSRFKAKTG